MSRMRAVLQALQDANDRRDRAAVLALVTPDVEYHYHVGSKPLVGPEKIGRFLDAYWGRSQDPEWHIETWAEAGDKLLVEGHDAYTDIASGERIVNRYMGILEFRDGRVHRWRDYFQLGPVPG